MSERSLTTWGWRLAFLAAAPLALVGLYLRLRTEESDVFVAARRGRGATAGPAPVRVVFRRNWRQLLQLTALQSLGSPYYLIIVYLPVYLRQRTGIGASEAAWAGLIAIATMAALVPIAAVAGDRFGRRVLFLGSGLLTMALVVPAFRLAGAGGFGTAVLGALMLSVPLAGYYGAISAAQNELFATDVRATGAGIGYNIGVVLFSGLPPFLAAALVTATANELAPAYMVMVLVVAGLVAAAGYPRRHRLGLGEIDRAPLPARHEAGRERCVPCFSPSAGRKEAASEVAGVQAPAEQDLAFVIGRYVGRAKVQFEQHLPVGDLPMPGP